MKKRVSIDNAQELETKLGKIVKSTVVGNLGLIYTLEIETTNPNSGELQTWIVKTGGDAEPFEMFRYNFTSTNWGDHIRVGIRSIERKRTMKDNLYS